MLASIQRQLEEQQAEAARECKKAALEKDVVVRVRNQLATQDPSEVAVHWKSRGRGVSRSPIITSHRGDHPHRKQSKARQI